MRFQVPQFIEVEDKIFGPLTIKQFVYLAGGGGLGFICVKLLPWYIGIIPGLALAGLGLALAFYKVNNRPFIYTLENSFRYMMGKKLYLWKKEARKLTPNTELAKKETEIESLLSVPRLADSKLKDLTWSLDVANEALNPITRGGVGDNRKNAAQELNLEN